MASDKNAIYKFSSSEKNDYKKVKIKNFLPISDNPVLLFFKKLKKCFVYYIKSEKKIKLNPSLKE